MAYPHPYAAAQGTDAASRGFPPAGTWPDAAAAGLHSGYPLQSHYGAPPGHGHYGVPGSQLPVNHHHAHYPYGSGAWYPPQHAYPEAGLPLGPSPEQQHQQHQQLLALQALQQQQAAAAAAAAAAAQPPVPPQHLSQMQHLQHLAQQKLPSSQPTPQAPSPRPPPDASCPPGHWLSRQAAESAAHARGAVVDTPPPGITSSLHAKAGSPQGLVPPPERRVEAASAMSRPGVSERPMPPKAPAPSRAPTAPPSRPATAAGAAAGQYLLNLVNKESPPENSGAALLEKLQAGTSGAGQRSDPAGMALLQQVQSGSPSKSHNGQEGDGWEPRKGKGCGSSREWWGKGKGEGDGYTEDGYYGSSAYYDDDSRWIDHRKGGKGGKAPRKGKSDWSGWSGAESWNGWTGEEWDVDRPDKWTESAGPRAARPRKGKGTKGDGWQHWEEADDGYVEKNGDDPSQSRWRARRPPPPADGKSKGNGKDGKGTSKWNAVQPAADDKPKLRWKPVEQGTAANESKA